MPAIAGGDHTISRDSLLLGGVVRPVDLDRLTAAVAPLAPSGLEAAGLAAQVGHVGV